MATFLKLASGNWRVQVRRKGAYASETFRRKADAEQWALATERRADRGEAVDRVDVSHLKTFGDLIDLHVADMTEVGKTPRRTKKYSLDLLKSRLGKIKFQQLTRERLVEYGRDRSGDGAGPVTVAMEIGYIGTILTHAAAVHGVNVTKEPVELARVALRRLGLVGKGQERDRRPTQQEVNDLISYLDGNPRQTIPVGRIIKFAIATAMRQEEISRITWEDVDARKHLVLVRDRKDPRDKRGNHQKVPLLALTGYDAWQLMEEQAQATGRKGRVFPYNGRSVGTAFRRACQELEIEDLHFHDLRHEATSRYFEAGLAIQQVALITGHRDWKMLRRYANLRVEDLTAKYRACA